MSKYIYSDTIPPESPFFTPRKRYQILDEYNHRNRGNYMVDVRDDNGALRTMLNVGAPCAFLNGERWTPVIEEL